MSWFVFAGHEAGFTSRTLLGVEGDPTGVPAGGKQSQRKSVCGHHRARGTAACHACAGCCWASRDKGRWRAQHTHVLRPAACPGGDLSRAEGRVVCRQAGRMLKPCQRCVSARVPCSADPQLPPVPAPRLLQTVRACTCAMDGVAVHRDSPVSQLSCTETYLGHPLTRHPWHHGIQSLRCIPTCLITSAWGWTCKVLEGAHKSTTYLRLLM